MNMNTETTTIEAPLEVVEAGVLEKITRAEIDVQIATAKKYPRSMQLFVKRATEMATLDEETAASCIYCRPVGSKMVNGRKEVEYAEGMSIRMAEIVGASYGNLRVGALVVEQTESFVKTRGMAHDLESNFACTSEIIESTLDKGGKPFSQRMRLVVAKAALAKALRDATFKVVPRALAKPIEKAAKKVAMGDAKSIGMRRASVVAWIKKLGIDEHRVWSALGIQGESDLDEDRLATLTGIRTALKDGDVSVEEAFPVVPVKPTVHGKTAESAKVQEKDNLDMGPPATPTAKPAVLVDDEPATGPASVQTEAKGAASTLQAKMQADGITEAELKAVLVRAQLMAPEQEVPALADSVLIHACNCWQQVVAQVEVNRKRITAAQKPTATDQQALAV